MIFVDTGCEPHSPRVQVLYLGRRVNLDRVLLCVASSILETHTDLNENVYGVFELSQCILGPWQRHRDAVHPFLHRQPGTAAGLFRLDKGGVLQQDALAACVDREEVPVLLIDAHHDGHRV